MSRRLLDQSLRTLAAGLRAQHFTAPDLLREAREALDAGEPWMHAYKLRLDGHAARAADAAQTSLQAGHDLGALQGIPVSVKDLYGLPGVPIHAGSARELPERFRAPGPLVRRLLAQEAVIMGKTHTVEFAFGALGINNHWGTPRNPWDASWHRVPGGSSSGAGVSLVQGSAIVALGSDTAGSVRVPASLTGTVGYKPTAGRWSTEGIVPLSRTFDTPGVLARTVEDAWIAACDLDLASNDDATLERVRPATGIRIGIPDDHLWDACEPGIAEGVRAALAQLERAGHRLVPMRLPEAAEAFALFQAGGTSGAELNAFLAESLPGWVPLLDPIVGARMKLAAELSADELAARFSAFAALARRAASRFDDVHVIVSPTTPIAPPRLDACGDRDRYRERNLMMIRNTCLANLLGLNGLTMPVGLDALGLPVGLQLMAAANRDDTLFAAGLAFEKILGTARERLGAPPWHPVDAPAVSPSASRIS